MCWQGLLKFKHDHLQLISIHLVVCFYLFQPVFPLTRVCRGSLLCAIVVRCWREPALQLCRYQTADKMLTKKTFESKRETAGAILAEQWRCQTVILSRCQKPQYGHWNCTAWTICFSVQEKKAVEHKKRSFHGIVSAFFFEKYLYLSWR